MKVDTAQLAGLAGVVSARIQISPEVMTAIQSAVMHLLQVDMRAGCAG